MTMNEFIIAAVAFLAGCWFGLDRLLESIHAVGALLQQVGG